ncbi:protein of unknown function [Geodermatophilus amargosae]|uniref:DUF4865 domain-containing protein n=2 Tax=Geodermatophilus amargosae TaxID=1296565 RepID=A0A1I7B9T6_9ACTN|nr:protein of unknown function [Geodermatophilus amargosae]
MHVMQYEIGLPADYDMGVIEHRVATRGAATDDFPHLGLKAYAVRRKGRHGSPVNAYAPFYLWRDPAGLDAFLYGPFRAITADFGRPPVRHWIGAAFEPGPATGAPAFATRELVALPDDVPPGEAVAEALQTPAPEDDGWHSRAVAVDPARWELVRFTLWTAAPDRVPAGATAFDVLHASTPCLEQLTRGRLW